MFPSKQKTIKDTFSSDKFKKVEKIISKFFLFDESICHSEKSWSVREAHDDDGENVRVLSSSSSDDGEDGDNDDGDGGDGGDDIDGKMVMMTIMGQQ